MKEFRDGFYELDPNEEFAINWTDLHSHNGTISIMVGKKPTRGGFLSAVLLLEVTPYQAQKLYGDLSFAIEECESLCPERLLDPADPNAEPPEVTAEIREVNTPEQMERYVNEKLQAAVESALVKEKPQSALVEHLDNAIEENEYYLTQLLEIKHYGQGDFQIKDVANKICKITKTLKELRDSRRMILKNALSYEERLSDKLIHG